MLQRRRLFIFSLTFCIITYRIPLFLRFYTFRPVYGFLEHFLLRNMGTYGKFSGYFLPASKIFNSPSLFSVLNWLFNERMSPSRFGSMERIYSGICLGGMILLTFWIRKGISGLTLCLFHLTVGHIILPVASYDYHLILHYRLCPFFAEPAESQPYGGGYYDPCTDSKTILDPFSGTLPDSTGRTYLRLTEPIFLTPVLLLALLIIRLLRSSSFRPSEGRIAWEGSGNPCIGLPFPGKGRSPEKTRGFPERIHGRGGS